MTAAASFSFANTTTDYEDNNGTEDYNGTAANGNGCIRNDLCVCLRSLIVIKYFSSNRTTKSFKNDCNKMIPFSNSRVEVEMFTYIVEGILLTVVSLIGKSNYEKRGKYLAYFCSKLD